MLWTYILTIARTYWRAFGYVRRYLPIMILAGILSIGLGLTSGLATYSFLPVFGIVFSHGDVGGAGEASLSQLSVFDPSQWQQFLQVWLGDVFQSVAGGGSLMSQLVRLVGFIALLSLISSSLQLAVHYIFISIQAHGIEALRSDVFYHITKLPYSFFTRTRAGELISRVQNDLSGTIVMVTSSISSVLQYLISALVFFGLLLWINFDLVLVIMPVLVVAGGVAFLVGHWTRRNQQQILILQADITSVIHELLGGIKVIKAFAAEWFEQERWNSSIQVWRRFEIMNGLIKTTPNHLKEVIIVLVSGAVLIFGGQAILRGELTVSELLLFFIVLIRFQLPLAGLIRVWIDIQNGMGYALRTFDLLDMEQEPAGGGVRVPPIERELALHSVSFDYGFEPVLRDVSLELVKGTVTALVGASGSGKSSLADLLLRLYKPTRGQITLDGTDICAMNVYAYRALFGVVTQDTFLFHDTIRNNIAYGAGRTVSDHEVIEAAEAAYANAFIQELPQGYETVIGDRGVRLSGGQRQRLAIARAILRDAPLLILDEATSALDSQAERQVQAALQQLMVNRTTLVIAHRLSTVVAADAIAVLHQGKIVELGKHEQLLAYDGIYRHLWSLQAL